MLCGHRGIGDDLCFDKEWTGHDLFGPRWILLGYFAHIHNMIMCFCSCIYKKLMMVHLNLRNMFDL